MKTRQAVIAANPAKTQVSYTAVRQAAVYVLGIPISRFGRSAWFLIRARHGSNVTPWDCRSEKQQAIAVKEAKRLYE